nr:SpoIIE family protein phosphatase [Pyrinomonadaceae bacterium]
ANLFYSIYALASAFNLACGNFLAFGHQSAMGNAILTILATLIIAVSFVALLAFLHVAFRRPFGLMFWTITATWALSVFITIVFLSNGGWFRLVPSIGITLSFSYSIYLLVRALMERRAGAWILLGGVQVLALGMFAILLTQLKILKLPDDYFFLVELALILGVPVAVSIFLARNFARTNRDLEEQLAQVKQLSLQQIEQERDAAILRAENDRRAKELEEARQLQLSMLPKHLPQLPDLEIAAYMKPATEVGGDYYDFHLGADGTLTVAVGDATGHGLKAGTVVAATKSLFNAFAGEQSIPQIFARTSQALKRMNMRGLYMAMVMVKIKDGHMTISAAGMPPALIYRESTKEIEEVVIRAMPLGSVSNFAYQQQEFTLSAGDAVLMMSDGFPEMFNEHGEMLDYGKAKTVLEEVAQSTPQEIINRFMLAGDEWAGTRAQDDDVTFVVLKVKDGGNGAGFITDEAAYQ